MISDALKPVCKATVRIAYSFDLASDTPDSLEVDVYELAEQFVDEGLFGEIPTAIANYLDYDAIARDLGSDYTETTIAGVRLVYRCS